MCYHKNEKSSYGHQQQGAQKKSQSVPPPQPRIIDCLDCPGASPDVEEYRDQATTNSASACSCPRKRKEPQDSVHEHERKFSRSSSLELEKDDLRSNMLLLLAPERLKGSQETFLPPSTLIEDNHVLKEVQEHVQLKKNNSEPDLRKKPRRRKRQRKEIPQEFKENTLHEVDEAVHRTSVHADVKELNRTSSHPDVKEVNKREMEEPESKETRSEVQRKSALSFLFNNNNNNNNNSPDSLARRSSSPLPMESPVSPAAQVCKRSASIGSGAEKPAESKGEFCWVSQRLAHIMRVETEKETMCLDTESPRSCHLLDSGRFLEQNKHLDANRKNEMEKEKPRLKQLTKQLSNLRRRIEEVERQLFEEQGYRPSHQDKLNSPQLKTLLAEQASLKKEIKAEKENAESKERIRKFGVNGSAATEKCLDRIRVKLAEILDKMAENRKSKNRPVNYQDMSLEQVFEEKLELQSLLRDYEKEFGHPESRAEKDTMKEVYERYRVIKRMARRSSQVRSGDSSVELVTIPEDEEIDLTLMSPQHRIHLQLPTKPSSGGGSSSGTGSSSSGAPSSRHDMDLPSFIRPEDPAGGEDGEAGSEGSTSNLWHAMSREELLGVLKAVREDKKIARRAVKEFEDRFRNMTGRRVTKEDREPLEKTYKVYKNSKSKVKLINALLSKQSERVER